MGGGRQVTISDAQVGTVETGSCKGRESHFFLVLFFLLKDVRKVSDRTYIGNE
jgi:hypothetical protein